MDCNSIVYDAVHSIDTTNNLDVQTFENEIIEKVILNIKEYIELIKPNSTIFIAFDGVAPFAKMEQQRTRRYRNKFMSTMDFGDSNKNNWNTSAITPGTKFMDNLSYRINYEFKNAEKKYNVKNIYVSCSDDAGEGEHKLFSHTRKCVSKNENIAIYGLDSDLIMLSLFHLKYCKNIYVFREAPEFLKSSIPIDVRGNNDEPHFLDIENLSKSISNEMNCKYSDVQRTYDYVFLCFFLGNDFLPHFPAMNIRTHGINCLIDFYRLYIGNFQDRFLISKTTGRIQWKNVSVLIHEIAKKEHELLINEYFVRNKFDKRTYTMETPKEREETFQNLPIIFREEEKYICPDEPMWENRYYKRLLHCKRNGENIKRICNNYLEGLEWVFKYYSEGCPHWRWKYNYHYPPLFADLCKYIPHFEMDFISNKSNITNSPFSKLAQLSYVMPKSNLEFLPQNICNFLINNYPELYPENYDFKWAFCRYFWEAHPILPEIPVELLEQWEIQFNMCK
jgi:5'-3' exonuclease